LGPFVFPVLTQSLFAVVVPLTLITWNLYKKEPTKHMDAVGGHLAVKGGELLLSVATLLVAGIHPHLRFRMGMRGWAEAVKASCSA
jgi:hypothetical protein